MTTATAATRIRLGISSCLLGEQVRFDGGDKRNAFINDTLGRFFDWVQVCPEVAIGLGVPREPIRLVGDARAPRAVGVHNSTLDVSAALTRYGRQMALELVDISGYIFKRDSPSCGMERVKVYQSGRRHKYGAGLYARAFMDQLPVLPVEEEGRLADSLVRENFIGRVFAYRRWQELIALRLTPAGLVDFHTDHKLTLMAHGIENYRALGQVVADAGAKDLKLRAENYIAGFMAALKPRATRKCHTNVLIHILGYLKNQLDGEDKVELLETIESYRLGRVALNIPLTLLKHHFRLHPNPYIARQTYIYPHPIELVLRESI